MAESRLARSLLRVASGGVLVVPVPAARGRRASMRSTTAGSRPGRRRASRCSGSSEALNNRQVMRARRSNSLLAATVATSVALVLGTLAAIAVHRFSLLRSQTISFLLVLPIALPGVVTGIALQRTFGHLGRRFRAADGRHRPRDVLRRRRLQQRDRAAATLAVIARGGFGRPRRRTCGRRSDGSPARGSGTALLSGALLAFALSFDEIIVTNVHGRPRHPDDPDVDLYRDPAAERAAGRQRRRVRADPAERRSPCGSRSGSAGAETAGARL